MVNTGRDRVFIPKRLQIRQLSAGNAGDFGELGPQRPGACLPFQDAYPSAAISGQPPGGGERPVRCCRAASLRDQAWITASARSVEPPRRFADLRILSSTMNIRAPQPPGRRGKLGGKARVSGGSLMPSPDSGSSASRNRHHHSARRLAISETPVCGAQGTSGRKRRALGHGQAQIVSFSASITAAPQPPVRSTERSAPSAPCRCDQAGEFFGRCSVASDPGIDRQRPDPGASSCRAANTVLVAAAHGNVRGKRDHPPSPVRRVFPAQQGLLDPGRRYDLPGVVRTGG